MSRDTNVIFTEIKQSFKTLNDHFIDKNQQTYLLGYKATDINNPNPNPTTSSDNKHLLYLVCSYTQFQNTIGLNLQQITSARTISYSNIIVNENTILDKVYSIVNDTTSANDTTSSKMKELKTLRNQYPSVTTTTTPQGAASTLANSSFTYNYDATNINFSRLLDKAYFVTATATATPDQFVYTQNFNLDIYEQSIVIPGTNPGGSNCPTPGSTGGTTTPSTTQKVTVPFANLLDLLNCIRVTYNFLEPSNFSQYKTTLGKSDAPNMKINTYEFLTAAESGSTTTTIPGVYAVAGNLPSNYYVAVGDTAAMTSAEKQQFMKTNIANGTTPDIIVNKYINRIIKDVKTLDPLTTRIDGIRRVLLAYEMMIHIQIAAYVFRNHTGASSNDSIKNIARNLLEICILNFVNLNYQYLNQLSTSSVTGSDKTLYDRVTDVKLDYYTKKNSLNLLSGDIQNIKENINKNLDLKSSNTFFQTRVSIVFYVYIVLFILIIFSLVFIHGGFIVQDNQNKLRLTLGILILSIAFLVILHYVYRYFVIDPETFQDTPPAQRIDIITQTQLDTDLYLNYIANNTLLEYMINTINLLYMLDTLNSYSDFASSIHKENTYFTHYQYQLRQNKERIYNEQAENFRQGKISQYRTYLFAELCIVITIYMAVFMYTKHYFFGIIAFIVILLVVYKYIYNVNNLVRTDSTKLYWDSVNAAGQSGSCLIKL